MKISLKTLLAISTMLFTFSAGAQIKVHGDNHISIGSVNKDFGVQVQPSGYTYFANRTNHDWNWITLSYVNNDLSKCWIVSNSNHTNNHTFFVTGNGYVYKRGALTLADVRTQSERQQIDEASGILDQITGYYYTFNDGGSDSKKADVEVGFTAQEIEKILPSAVYADENGCKYVNYDVLTVFLVEGMKELNETVRQQQKQIEELYSMIKKYK